MSSIQTLDWDSALFGRKIGVLQFEPDAPADVEHRLDEARRDGYRYVMCRPSIEDAALIRALGRAQFYLSDQGVTWAIDLAAWIPPAAGSAHTAVVPATAADVPELQRLIRFMFPDSRFYHDPFFSTDDAETLHQEWIKNSVSGAAADCVLWLPGSGFVTLKKRGQVGEIVLIGIEKTQRGRGLGATLLTAAMARLAAQGASRVTVRTQLRNLRASQFYRVHGFSLVGADLTFSRVLPDPA